MSRFVSKHYLLIMGMILFISLNGWNIYRVRLFVSEVDRIQKKNQLVIDDISAQLEKLNKDNEHTRTIQNKLENQIRQLQNSYATSPVKLTKKYFPEFPVLALAIFKAESGLNADAVGWNCYYGTISTSCKSGDRSRAWSVDCGIAQNNFNGQTCPKESFDINYSLTLARKKYDERRARGLTGFEAWSAYLNGKHHQFISWAEKQL